MKNNSHYEQNYSKIFLFLFNNIFKMFGWVKKLVFSLLKKTEFDDKVPTNSKFDEDVEKLLFHMQCVWPLISSIVKQRVMSFFKYKSKKLFLGSFYIFIVLVIGIGAFKSYSLYTREPEVVYVKPPVEIVDGLIINRDTIFIPAERSVLNKDNLDFFASEMGIKYWYFVRNQIIIETGFTSESCVKAYNLFGMKFPRQRETTAIGKMFGYSKYKHWAYSLYDYKLWQDYMLKSTPIRKGESYPQWLVRVGYAQSESYLQFIAGINWYTFKESEYNN